MSERSGVELVTWRADRPEWATAFLDLNLEWIEKHFEVEPEDLRLLEDPQRTILDGGGEVLFAVDSDRVLGTCALIRVGPAEFELAKMAVTPDARGRGVGERMLLGALELARNRGAIAVTLETNRQLKPAIHLYEKVGFREVAPAHESAFSRCDLAMRLEI